jgi:hypothetical protein
MELTNSELNITVRTRRVTKRLRLGYPAVLSEAFFDFARERGYQLQGTNEAILASLRAMAK